MIKNGYVISDSIIRKKDILIHNDLIADEDFKGEIPKGCNVYNASDCYVSPGFIDIHVHGGGGYDFMDCAPDAFRNISKTHLQNGTTTLLATAVSAEFKKVLELVDVYKKAKDEIPNIFGIHLEGPFLSKKQKGAHHEELLHSPTDDEIDALCAVNNGVIKRITAAPELKNMDYFSKRMLEQGIILSIGHSDATSVIAKEAFKKGFSLITHFYNATTSVRKIDQQVVAGIQEAALLNDDIAIEIIADGKHTAVESVQLAVRIKGTDKVALITDALRPAGLNVTESYLGEKIPENKVIIEDGVAKLPDRSSFAGSVATASTLLEKGVNYYHFSLADTVRMLTETPAAILGIKNKGLVKEGYIADLVIFDNTFKVKKVFLGGKLVERLNL